MFYNTLKTAAYSKIFYKIHLWEKPVSLVSTQFDITVKGKQLFSDIKNRNISKHEAEISNKNTCEQLNV